MQSIDAIGVSCQGCAVRLQSAVCSCAALGWKELLAILAAARSTKVMNMAPSQAMFFQIRIGPVGSMCRAFCDRWAMFNLGCRRAQLRHRFASLAAGLQFCMLLQIGLGRLFMWAGTARNQGKCNRRSSRELPALASCAVGAEARVFGDSQVLQAMEGFWSWSSVILLSQTLQWYHVALLFFLRGGGSVCSPQAFVRFGRAFARDPEGLASPAIQFALSRSFPATSCTTSIPGRSTSWRSFPAPISCSPGIAGPLLLDLPLLHPCSPAPASARRA